MFDTRKQIVYLYSSFDEFISETTKIKPELEKSKLKVNFIGYADMITKLYNVDEKEDKEMFAIGRELLLWTDALKDYRHMFINWQSGIENKLLYLEGFLTERENVQLNQKIAENDRIFQMSKEYLIILDKQIKSLNMILKNVMGRIKELSNERKRMGITI